MVLWFCCDITIFRKVRLGLVLIRFNMFNLCNLGYHVPNVFYFHLGEAAIASLELLDGRIWEMVAGGINDPKNISSCARVWIACVFKWCISNTELYSKMIMILIPLRE